MNYEASDCNLTFVSETSEDKYCVYRRYLLKEYPKFLTIIPDHWLLKGLPSEDLVFTKVLAFFFFAMTSVTIPAIIFVYCVYFGNRNIHDTTNKLVISLTTADLLMITKNIIYLYNIYYDYPIGYYNCIIFGFFGTTAGLAEIWTITLISFHRAMRIKNLRFPKGPKIEYLAVIAWAMAIFFAFMPIVGWNRYVPEAYIVTCTFDTWNKSLLSKSYVHVLVLLAWVAPMIIICSCYYHIYYTAKRSCKKLQKFGNVFKGIKKSNSIYSKKLEQRLSKMTFLIVMVWVIGWTPYAAISVCESLGYGGYITPFFSLVCFMFCKLSALCNTFIYGLQLPQYRSKFNSLRPVQFINNLATRIISTSMLDRMASKKTSGHIPSEPKKKRGILIERKEFITFPNREDKIASCCQIIEEEERKIALLLKESEILLSPRPKIRRNLTSSQYSQNGYLFSDSFYSEIPELSPPNHQKLLMDTITELKQKSIEISQANKSKRIKQKAPSNVKVKKSFWKNELDKSLARRRSV